MLKIDNSVKSMLFVCYGAGHINMLLPLIKELIRSEQYKITVLGLTMAGPVLEKHGIPYIGFKDLVEPEDEKSVFEIGSYLAEGMPKGGEVSSQETVSYLGLSYLSLIKEYGPQIAEKLYAERGRQSFLPLDVLRLVFDRYAPDVLVSTNSPRSERAAFIVARERNIPAVCVVGLFAKQEIEWIGERDYSNRICVISEAVKQSFLDVGRSKDEVIVTGNPALDRLSAPLLAKQADAMRRANHWRGKKIILWASQPEPEKHPFTGDLGDPDLPRQVEQMLLFIAEKYLDWQIVIRYHPGERVPSERWPEKANISTSDDDLAVLLKAVDVVITMTSTVGLEGVLLGKPLITINQSIFHDDAPYDEMGIALGVGSLDALEDAILQVFSGKWRPKETLPEVGTATTSVINVIENVLRDQEC